jgi:hypothetical protein
VDCLANASERSCDETTQSGITVDKGPIMALGFHQQTEVERIQSKLAEFLPAQEARAIASQVYDLALDVDEEIDRILKDPLVDRLYEYDGQFFTPRNTGLFHTAFDGLHILKWLGNSMLDTFFRGKKKRFAIEWLLDELHNHSWVAKRRRMNWEESRTLGLLTKEAIQELIDIHEDRRQAEENPPPLSFEEQAFFKYFECEMSRPYSPR